MPSDSAPSPSEMTAGVDLTKSTVGALGSAPVPGKAPGVNLKEITPGERALLLHFFTNLDQPVFVAKNFHPEVWALMQARYSRSQDGLREGFLTLLKEDATNYAALEKILSDESNRVGMDKAVEKAIAFMDKWVLGYGHSSVAEGAIVGVGIEGVSSVCSDEFMNNRIGSFIEKSTRYVDFTRDSFHLDADFARTKEGQAAKKYLDELFTFYQDCKKPVLEYVMKVAPKTAGTDESAWKRSCAARRFDAIRTLLPAATRTSFGWTVNARQLAHAISKMLSSPHAEVRQIGGLLKREAQKQLPSLLKYANENRYFSESRKSLDELTQGMLQAKTSTINTNTSGSSVVLVEDDTRAEEKLVAALLFEHSFVSYPDALAKAQSLSATEKSRVMDAALGKMGEFDYPQRFFENAHFTFDVTMDYGSYRDLHRHRMATQLIQPLSTRNGLHIPPDMEGAGLREKYLDMMKRAADVWELVYANPATRANAAYLVPRGYNVRVLFSSNARELYHFIKLRSSAHAHYTIRLVAQEMWQEIHKKHPILSNYLKVTMGDSALGRLSSEQKFEEKLKKGLL